MKREIICECGAEISVDITSSNNPFVCPECNILIDLTSLFPLEKPPTGIYEEERNLSCQYCGYIQSTLSEYCQNCGERLFGTATDVPNNEVDKMTMSEEVLTRSESVFSKFFRVLLPIITFILGFVIGVMLCPGYTGILPPGYSIFPQFFSK